MRALLFFLFLFFFSFHTAFAQIDFCSDSSPARIVHPQMPLTDPDYAPSVLTELSTLQSENGPFQVLGNISVNSMMLHDLLRMAGDFKEEFQSPLLILRGYEDVETLERKKTVCVADRILCQGKGLSDRQLGLSLSLVTSNNSSKNANDRKKLTWLDNHAQDYNFVKLYDGKDGLPELNYYWRWVGPTVINILKNQHLDSYYHFLKQEQGNPQLKCFQPFTHLTAERDTSNDGDSNTGSGTTSGTGATGTTTSGSGSDSGVTDIFGEGGGESIAKFRTDGFGPDGTFPGTFQGSYRDFDKELLKVLKVNLVVSDSFSNMANNFGMQNVGPYSDIYLDAIAYLEKGENMAMPWKKDEYLQMLKSPFIQWAATQLIPAISLREHGGDIKQNPGNSQGVFQMLIMGRFMSGRFSCTDSVKDGTYKYFSTCERMKKIYAPRKELTKDEMLEQFINVYIWIWHKYSNLEKILGNSQNNYSYYMNLKHILNGLQDELQFSDEEREKLIDAIITSKLSELQSFIQSKSNVFTKYAINTPEDFKLWMEFIRGGTIFTLYNGADNNGSKLVLNQPNISFVLDHAYVSNSPAYGMCFLQIAYDGTRKTNISRNPGAIYNYLQVNFPQEQEKATLGFATLLRKMGNAGKLHAYKSSYCGN